MERHYDAEAVAALSKKEYAYTSQDGVKHEYTRYEAEQAQRKIERTIRKHKKRAAVKEGAGLDCVKEKQAIGQWQAVARDFVKQTGLRRDYAREYVGVERTLFNPTQSQPRGSNKKSENDFSAGSPRPVNSIADFKKAEVPVSMEEAMKQVNPNFKKGFAYQNNCQRCAPTYEAIRRGYDVLAKPTTAKSKEELSSDKLADYEHNGFASMYKNPDIISADINKQIGKVEIEKQMQEWGNGARCTIFVFWKKYEGGHIFIAEQVNDKTLFIDPQTNKVYNENIFDKVQLAYTKIFRTDNLEFSDEIIECCFNRKEGENKRK